MKGTKEETLHRQNKASTSKLESSEKSFVSLHYLERRIAIQHSFYNINDWDLINRPLNASRHIFHYDLSAQLG